MLTRSKKKRSDGKDKSYPQNSNQKYSAVHGNDAVEVGEMVTMHHAGTNGGLDDGCQRMDYLQVAWLLREKLNDLVDSDKGEFPGLGLRSLLDMAATHNIVSVDPKVLNPVLWRTLPKELLLLVFARLPLPDITRLRCLSREWRREMATLNSEINQACHEASPPMVALLSHYSTDTFLVSIYDIKKCRRPYVYRYRLQLHRPGNGDSEQWPHTWTPIDACDGGLVCFISLRVPTKRNGLCIVVVNLLTRVHHELPPLHYRYCTLPSMVQIKVDFDTKCYKVVVAAYKNAEIYDSVSRQWTRVAPPFGSIFGLVHTWTNCVNGWCRELSAIPGAYDFAKEKCELYSESPSIGGSVIGSLLIDSVLKKDRMFLLLVKQRQTDASLRRRVPKSLCITEYHLEKQTKDWVQGKSYACPSYEQLRVEGPLSAMFLKACDGFLMVITHHLQRSQSFWLLDLSTSEWSKLQEPTKDLHTKASVLCRSFWNVIP